jgi:hypothetical protein
MRRSVLASALSVSLAFGASPPAHADPEIDTLVCSGVVGDGLFDRVGRVITTGSINCTGLHLLGEGNSSGSPSFGATVQLDIFNQPLGPSLTATRGSAVFDVDGVPWTLDFNALHVVVAGVMPFAVGVNTGSQYPLADDTIGPTAAGELVYHLRAGAIVSTSECIQTCRGIGEFHFVAEWLHELPVAR